jgi:hypothetical protein
MFVPVAVIAISSSDFAALRAVADNLVLFVTIIFAFLIL